MSNQCEIFCFSLSNLNAIKRIAVPMLHRSKFHSVFQTYRKRDKTFGIHYCQRIIRGLYTAK